MIHTLWTVIFYQPLYNALLLCIWFIPNGDVGIAVILLTIIVKFILFPLTQKSINTQLKMKDLEQKIAAIKESTSDKAEQSKKTFALYKENNVNPFSSCLLLLVQLPLIIALYLVFQNDFNHITIGHYAFVHAPIVFNLLFLGLVNISQKSLVLAVIAGITQFIQGYLAQGRQTKPTGTDMQSEFARSMQTQMLYFMPFIVVYAAYRFSAAVAIYWITSNIFTIGQELYTRNKIAKSQQLQVKAKVI
ncbi:MAG: YidC/Oxa1 family membrane protein insertase [bacterium]